MEAWLLETFRSSQMGEAVQEYCYRRGVSDVLMEKLGMTEWVPPSSPSPSIDFTKRYSLNGSSLVGRLIYPFWSPRGRLLGFEARSIEQKSVTDFRLPQAEWNPCWLGMSTDVMAQIWAGANVWVVEGIFDLVALSRVIQKPDVVLSSMKAGLSTNHVNFLSRFVRSHVVMAYDNDVTGYRMTHGYTDPKTHKFRYGAIQKLRALGVKASAHQYVGKDPGEVWLQGGDIALQKQFQTEGR